MTARYSSKQNASSPAKRKYPLGAVVPKTRAHSSKTERRVRTMLQERGVAVLSEDYCIQAGFDSKAGYWPILAPDLILDGHKVVVEVDPSGSPNGFEGHEATRKTDQHRNRLLKAAGWTTVRLRLGLGKGSAIGPYDVETEARNVSSKVLDALLAAISEAISHDKGQIRFVEKRPVHRRTSSRLGAISPHKYEDGYYVSWVKETGERCRFVLLDGGENLYGDDTSSKELRFIMRVGLDKIPRSEWRASLVSLFAANPDLAPAGRFPWGSELFLGAQELNGYLKKFRLSAEEHRFTVNISEYEAFSDTQIFAGGLVHGELHAEAVKWGWKIQSVEEKTGFRGEYQAIRLSRETT